jgi:hypothetical protein
MNEINNFAIHYFGAPINYFWVWAEKGEIIEWQDGATICFREELMAVLKSMAEQGLAPLGSLLLILAACQDSWKEVSADKTTSLKELSTYMEDEASSPGNEVLEYYIHQALRFMDTVHKLPKKWRSGKNVPHLIKEIYAVSGYLVPADKARNVVDEFSSGRLDYPVLRSTQEISREEFKADLDYLNQAFHAFPTTQALELQLRTGLTQLPAKAELALPEPEPLELLEQLAEDAKTAGIARLTNRLVAALTIPMHTQGSSQLPFGGISDVTNRGTFDRLLLSELAQDDESLVARLVNNEALYLRREEPPDTMNRQRTILLDSTIKMWGTPRVFAISAALAAIKNTKPTIHVHTYALGGNTYEAIDLTTKKGVVHTLERLDPALDCELALTSLMEAERKYQAHEYILITDEQVLHNPTFSRTLTNLQQPLTFLITVNRNGDFGFYESIHGPFKLLNKAKFDLKDLLFTPKKSSVRNGKEALPAFLTQAASTLYFPTSAMRLSSENTFHNSDFGVVGITANQRVLYWPFKVLGAKEILNYIEPGHYYFGFDGVVTLYILVNDSGKKLLKFYKIHTVKNEVESIDLSDEISQVQEAVFHTNLYFIRTSNGVVLYDCVNKQIDQHQHKETIAQLFSKYKNQRIWSDFSHLKRYVNNGYSVLQRVQSIFITDEKQLSLDGYELRLLDIHGIKWIDTRKIVGKNKVKTQELLPDNTINLSNSSIKFSRAVWRDGSEAVLDSRGLLHLRSSDSAIPEVTIVLVLGKVSAAWAADGKVAGSFYFTGVDPSQSLPVDEFYATYIQSFIDRLL